MPLDHDLQRRERLARERKLPLHDEINVHDSLDERSAVASLLGRTLEELEAGYRRGGLLHDSEDFMWMGPRAFCFYVDAGISYLKSEEASGDSDGVNGFLSAIAHRLEWDREPIAPAIPRLSDVCDYLLAHLDRYDLTPGIYDHVPDDLRALQRALRE